MSEYITKIRTDQGDKQIDYNALANLPTTDTTLSVAGQAADAKAVSTALDGMSTKFSNPNLLINSDFRNPINQRGTSSLTTKDESWTKFYSIDRWYSQHGATVEILDGYIKVYASATTTSGYFCQAFEDVLGSNKYTVAVNVKSVSGTANVYLKNTDGQQGTTLTEGINVLTATLPITSVEFQLLPGASVELYWVKLESGNIATPFIPRLPAEELTLCLRYYQCIECRLIMNVLTTELAQGVYYFSTPMRSTPSWRTINNATYYKFSDKTFVTPSSAVVHDMYINNKYAVIQIDKNAGDTFTAGNCISAVVTLTFDAEIY